MLKQVDVYLSEDLRQQLKAMLRKNLAFRTHQREKVILLLDKRLS